MSRGTILIQYFVLHLINVFNAELRQLSLTPKEWQILLSELIYYITKILSVKYESQKKRTG